MPVYEHNKARLSYDKIGSGPPVILIHGLSGSAIWWRRNVPVLAERYTVYVVDLVGFGRSRRQRILPLLEMARLLANWTESLQIEPPAIIAHSMGAQLSLYMLGLRLVPVRSLVLVAASALVKDPWWRMARLLPRAGWNGAWSFLPILAYDALRAGPLNLYSATQEIMRNNPTPLLQRIEVPVLLIWGAKDVLISQQMGEELRNKIAGASLKIIPGAGHNVMYDRPQAFNQAVMEFLADPQPHSEVV